MGPVSFACAFLTWPLSPTFGFPHREFLRVTDPRGHCALFFVPSVIFLFRPLQHGNTGSVVVSFVYIHRNSFYPWSGLSLGAGGGQDIKNRAVRADSAATSEWTGHQVAFLRWLGEAESGLWAPWGTDITAGLREEVSGCTWMPLGWSGQRGTRRWVSPGGPLGP